MRSHLFMIALALLLSFLGCSKPALPADEDRQVVPGKAKEHDPPPGKPEAAADFKLTAEEYSKEWKEHAKSAAAKYDGKIVELSGVVGHLDWGGRSLPRFTLRVRSGESIGCRFEDKGIWTKVSKGSKVTIRGRVSDDESGSDLTSCATIEVGPNPAVDITTEALAAEYGSDWEATLAKYKGKTLNLTGKITKKRTLDSSILLELEGGGGIVISCFFCSVIANLAEPLRVGQVITIVDRLSPHSPKKNELEFWGSNVVPVEK